MEKLNHARNFGKIEVLNYDFRPLLSEVVEYPVHLGLGQVRRRKKIHRFRGWGEKSYIKIDGKTVGYGQATWINRSRQRFNFDNSMYHAYKDALNSIDWATYYKYKKDFNKIRELVMS